MALNPAALQVALAARLEQEIRTALSLGATPYPQLTQFCEGTATAQANEILPHIVANAAVTVIIPAASYPVTGGGGGTVSIPQVTITNGTVL